MKYLKYIAVALFIGGCCIVPRMRPTTTDTVQEKSGEVDSEEIMSPWPHSFHLSETSNHETTFDIPVVINDRVEQFLEYYSTEAKLSFSTYLRRSTNYLEPMQDILERYGVPRDMVYLALIESGFNPFAYSPARAMGPWQFLAGTARIYGLRRDQWVDERRDPVKSTEAAARYLKDLYDVFGDWYLVLAAYNTGQYRVQKAMRLARSTDYWDLDLPSQTEEFVPRFLAAAIIAKNPRLYGFTTDFAEPLGHEIVFVDGQTDLKVAATCIGYDVDVLRHLNPELKNDVTPPHILEYPLRIPKGARDQFFICREDVVQNKDSRGEPQG